MAKADAVLVLNKKKKGIEGYLGGNTLMEMGVAFYLGKPIFLLNPPPKNVPYEEEILGLLPTVLNGELDNLKL